MTSKELQNYTNEINYQKHMLANLGRFMNVSFLVASIGIVLIYVFNSKNLFITIVGIILLVMGVLASLVLGLGIRNGRANVNKVIDDLEAKTHQSGR